MLALAGCDVDPGEGSRHSSPGVVALDLASAEALALDRALDSLIQGCLERGGLTVHPDNPNPVPYRLLVPEQSLPRPAEAEQRGLGIGVRASAPTPTGNSASAFHRLPRAQQERYFQARNGTPPTVQPAGSSRAEREAAAIIGRDGCRARATRQVFGADLVPYLTLRDVAAGTELDLSLNATAWRTPEVASARSAWQDCLSDKGFDGMTDPVTLRKKARERFYPTGRTDTLTGQAGERELAVAAAACEERTGMESKYRSAWERAYAEHLDQHRSDLTRWRTLTRRILDRARQAGT
ncbi:MAG: hypothetical protein QG622_2911 [Actinomycetota bacterium]|nr:hypothetical protein [Actinomycetota bacterium]